MRIVIAGAGSIGCFTGGLLAAAGHDVTLLARPWMVQEISDHGLICRDFSGLHQRLRAEDLALATGPECMSGAEMIIVTVKTPATPEMAGLIAQHAPPGIPVLSWQNGLENADLLRSALRNWDVRAGMVPFNVVPNGPGVFHRATSGDIVIEAGAGQLAQTLSNPSLPVSESDDIAGVQWGKLLVNLTNALNALSGLPLLEMLSDRDWRRLMADQMAEALGVLKTAGIAARSTTPLPVWLIPHVLRLPTPLFSAIAARMLTIDPQARTSMAYDLEQGRMTEIDSLQGVIVDLGLRYGVVTPLCQRIAEQICEAGAKGLTRPMLSPAEVRG